MYKAFNWIRASLPGHLPYALISRSRLPALLSARLLPRFQSNHVVVFAHLNRQLRALGIHALDPVGDAIGEDFSQRPSPMSVLASGIAATISRNRYVEIRSTVVLTWKAA